MGEAILARNASGGGRTPAFEVTNVSFVNRNTLTFEVPIDKIQLNKNYVIEFKIKSSNYGVEMFTQGQIGLSYTEATGHIKTPGFFIFISDTPYFQWVATTTAFVTSSNSETKKIQTNYGTSWFGNEIHSYETFAYEWEDER